MTDELHLVRNVLLRVTQDLPASSALAKSLVEWAAPHRTWLGLEAGKKHPWKTLLTAIASEPLPAGPLPHVLVLARQLGDVLDLDAFDKQLLTWVVGCERLPRLSDLTDLVSEHGHDLPTLLGELSGADSQDAVRMVRQSTLLRLGLARVRDNREGRMEFKLGWALDRLLDRGPGPDDDMIEILVGLRQPANLGLSDFGQNADIDFLVRLLRGALGEHAEGVNILIHGQPGTGKTELARTLARAVEATLYAIGETDDDGDEPTRSERVAALRLAQRLLGQTDGTILLFDEMEDLIGDTQPSRGDWFTRRSGSKIFVNRMLESNPLPVIWTTNAIGNVDAAILRRMSFVLKLDLPSRSQAHRMLDRVAIEERVDVGTSFNLLLNAAPETTTVLRVALRAGRLANDQDGGARSAATLIRSLRGEELVPTADEPFDIKVLEADRPFEALFERIGTQSALDISLLLTGPPGTGKTALAHHIARSLDRPLLTKRASDLLSPFVGGTESAIAEAFTEARQRQGVLFFDEVDSLLFDRGTAKTSWEVSQVNELLTWLDRHPFPIIAATNHGHKLDPAALRRFVFKIELKPLERRGLARAFEHFFGLPEPIELHTIRGLTPGDFAVAKRALRFTPDVTVRDILIALRTEVDAKPDHYTRMGFG